MRLLESNNARSNSIGSATAYSQSVSQSVNINKTHSTSHHAAGTRLDLFPLSPVARLQQFDPDDAAAAQPNATPDPQTDDS